MQDLTPVGLSHDGRRLLLISSAGEEFAVPVDTRLRAALRGENARLGQLEMKMESALRPRDIQARIRAGESPEDVAAAAQTTVEAIMGFATPVLAERAHVAQNAQRASVRRRSGESSSAGRTLYDAAELFFSDHGLHDEDVEWDAWRRTDGRWALVAKYAVGGRARTAEFTHDLPGRYVVAENDEARILTGELREPESREAAAGGRTAPARRLSSVRDQDELPLGDDAIELVRDRGPAAPAGQPDALAAEASVEPAEASVEPAEAESLPMDTADADWMVADDTARTAPAADHTEDESGGPVEPVETPREELAAGPTPAAQVEPEPELEVEPEPQPEPEPEPEPEPAPKQASKKRSRSSVPSWDEIMFGGGKNE